MTKLIAIAMTAIAFTICYAQIVSPLLEEAARAWVQRELGERHD